MKAYESPRVHVLGTVAAQTLTTASCVPKVLGGQDNALEGVISNGTQAGPVTVCEVPD